MRGGAARRKPAWLKVRPPGSGAFVEVKRELRVEGLHTVCEEARCPNQAECWAAGTATFLIMGDTCTRACRFCAVKTGNPHGWLDPVEPRRVAAACRLWKLRYAVITSVDRDDLPDGGAAHFAETVRAVKRAVPGILVEVLTPDFAGQRDAIARVLEAGPEVFGHNLETVRRLTPRVRDRRASYERSLAVLETARSLAPGVLTKSSLMLGLGETDEEVRQALSDLRSVGVEGLTLGQYLQPTPRQLPVVDYVSPGRFADWEREARSMGFRYVASGPLVRSSYRAGELYLEQVLRGRAGNAPRSVP